MNDKRTERLIDELDTLWEVLMKNEVTAIEAVSTAQKTRAKLRSVEQRVLRVEEENRDLRKRLDPE
jgi:RNAse (barnase) inhibitor barstar